MASMMLMTSAHAQYVRDNTYYGGCRQNIANPGNGYECKRINPDDTPYKNDWQKTVNINSVNVTFTGDTPETVRDRFLVAVNAEQERLEQLQRDAGYSHTSYRIIVNPNKQTCSEPSVANYWTHAPDYTRLGVVSYCYVWQIDTRYQPGAPRYLVTEFSESFSKLAVCEIGWKANGAGPPDIYGAYTKYPHICYKEQSSKEMGCTTASPTSCGNPINFGTGNKYQTEVDYVGTGPMPLRIERTYNSATPTDNSESTLLPSRLSFGKNWRFHYDRRLKSEGANTIWIARPDGKNIYFHLIAGSWKPDSEISDQLTIGGTGYFYFNRANRETETFDGAGRLVSITDQSGNVTTLEYSGSWLTTVTDPFGRTLTFAYSEGLRPKIAAITDPQGGVYSYAYTGEQVGQVVFPDGSARTYLYGETAYSPANSPSLMTGIINENNVRFATYKYDISGKAYSTEWAGGVNRYTVSGDAPINVTDPLGRTKMYSTRGLNGVRYLYDTVQPCAGTGCSGTVTEVNRYDANGNLTFYADLRGVNTKRTFDTTRNLELTRIEGDPLTPRTITTTWHPTFRLPASITEPVRVNGTNSTKTTSFGYDSIGNLIQRVVATPSGSRTWTWTYSVNGQVLTATDPMGRTTINTYAGGVLATSTNPLGQTTSVTGYNAHGQPTSMTDPNGLVTGFTYDLRLRLTSKTTQGQNTSYQYDNAGQLRRVTLPDNSNIDYFYDAAQRLNRIQDGLGNFTQYTLDNAGNRTREDVYDKNSVLARARSRVFDSLGRTIQDIGGASASQITQYAYDASGNQTGTTDALNRTTTSSYDALNRIIQVNDPVNGATKPTKYEYDLQDNLTKVTDPKNLATIYSYNGFSELISQTSPDTGTTSFSYDAAGNMLTKTDARNITVSYSYDNLNRVTTINYPATTSATGSTPAQTISYNYDTCAYGKGRLCSFTDRTGTTTYSYEQIGRITGKAQNINGLNQTVAYRYNIVGQMDEMTMPSGKKVAVSYLNNRITGLTVDGQPIVKSADYEPFGPIGEWTWGNDSVASPNKHTRYFDLDGRNTKIESGVVGNNAVDPAIIVYDAASRITALQRLTNNAVDPAKSTGYGYDNLDRLTSVTPNSGNPANAQSYSYDAIGNRLTNTVSGSTTTYSYGITSHRLNALTGAINKTFTHDNVGNRIRDGIQSWIYGADNRASAISLSGSNPVSIQAGINALGQRVLKTVNNASQATITRFVYDEAGRLIGEYDNNGRPIQETIWLNDLPVAVLK